jgi:hypothetical protein
MDDENAPDAEAPSAADEALFLWALLVEAVWYILEGATPRRA